MSVHDGRGRHGKKAERDVEREIRYAIRVASHHRMHICIVSETLLCRGMMSLKPPTFEEEEGGGAIQHLIVATKLGTKVNGTDTDT